MGSTAPQDGGLAVVVAVVSTRANPVTTTPRRRRLRNAQVMLIPPIAKSVSVPGLVNARRRARVLECFHRDDRIVDQRGERLSADRRRVVYHDAFTLQNPVVIASILARVQPVELDQTLCEHIRAQ